jgi:uncharacterized protein (TIGR00730 family)
LKNICVYCGSSSGNNPVYVKGAENLGKALAGSGIGLVYGGGKRGLMGAIADSALNAGGKVTGVIPQGLLDLELGHTGLTKLHIVKNMHERKALMAELSDAFIAMPGGLGTYEELFEVLSWSQLGLHKKPCGLLNINGFYNSMLQFLDKATEEGFIMAGHRAMLLSDADPDKLIDKLAEFQYPEIVKWKVKTEVVKD